MSHETLTRLGLRTESFDGAALRDRFPTSTPTWGASTWTPASSTCPR